MKNLLLSAMAAVVTTSCGHAQGVFAFSNQTAPTHIGSIDGPLAGSRIWAQMLAGPSPGSLAPVGMPAQHLTYIMGLPAGLVFGGVVTVPGILPAQTAYVEMLAWDGSRWGTIFSGVPKDQLGMTDIVPVGLADPNFGFSPPTPRFTQSAVIPIPEPATLALAVMAGLAAILFCGRRKRHPHRSAWNWLARPEITLAMRPDQQWTVPRSSG